MIKGLVRTGLPETQNERDDGKKIKKCRMERKVRSLANSDRTSIKGMLDEVFVYGKEGCSVIYGQLRFGDEAHCLSTTRLMDLESGQARRVASRDSFLNGSKNKQETRIKAP